MLILASVAVETSGSVEICAIWILGFRSFSVSGGRRVCLCLNLAWRGGPKMVL